MKNCEGNIYMSHEFINFREGKCPLCSCLKKITNLEAENSKLWRSLQKRVRETQEKYHGEFATQEIRFFNTRV